MDIFMILKLIGGLALFLYGMKLMGDSLMKLASSKMQQILTKLTNKTFYGVLLGAGVTAVIQSSSATTVMVVGLVNSGIMTLKQAVGIIMGANIGTTMTSWLLSLTGLESDVIFIKMLKPSSFAPVLALVGVILYMTAKESLSRINTGNLLIGFAILIYGMDSMSGAMAPLAASALFTNLMTTVSNPFFGIIVGMTITAIIQSSSASVGILQALCLSGTVTYGAAIPIILGQNIGTCATALLSSIGGSTNAKRASMIHLYFNIIGVTVFAVIFYGLNLIFKFDILYMKSTPVAVAAIHSIFNVGCTLMLYPFSKQLVCLVEGKYIAGPYGNGYNEFK